MIPVPSALEFAGELVYVDRRSKVRVVVNAPQGPPGAIEYWAEDGLSALQMGSVVILGSRQQMLAWLAEVTALVMYGPGGTIEVDVWVGDEHDDCPYCAELEGRS